MFCNCIIISFNVNEMRKFKIYMYYLVRSGTFYVWICNLDMNNNISHPRGRETFNGYVLFIETKHLINIINVRFACIFTEHIILPIIQHNTTVHLSILCLCISSIETGCMFYSIKWISQYKQWRSKISVHVDIELLLHLIIELLCLYHF